MGIEPEKIAAQIAERLKPRVAMYGDDIRALIVSKVQNDVGKVAYALLEHFPGCIYYKEHRYLLLKNGSRIYFRHARTEDDAHKLRGYTFTDLYKLDEFNPIVTARLNVLVRSHNPKITTFKHGPFYA